MTTLRATHGGRRGHGLLFPFSCAPRRGPTPTGPQRLTAPDQDCRLVEGFHRRAPSDRTSPTPAATNHSGLAGGDRQGGPVQRAPAGPPAAGRARTCRARQGDAHTSCRHRRRLRRGRRKHGLLLTSRPPSTPSAPLHTSAGPRKPGTRHTEPAKSHANSTADPLLAPSPTVPAARLCGGSQQRYLAAAHGLLTSESSRDGRTGRTGCALRR